MSSLESKKGERIHTRNIRIATYRVDEASIIIEGTLEDERMVTSHTITGRQVLPGKFHGMTARFLVGEVPPKILDAEADMYTIPDEACGKAEQTLEELVGLPIVYGFSKEVKDRLGGIKGCTHLTSLVLAMGSAAIQGFAANRGRRGRDLEERKLLLQYIKDSCLMWGDGGEFYKKVMKDIGLAEGDGQDGA